MSEKKPLLQVENLYASVKIEDNDPKPILKGVNLTIYPGEVHAVMGPNGSGKSTLAQVIAGNPNFIVTGGKIYLNQEPIQDLTPEVRAGKGVFIGFQAPPSIPGVSNDYFLRSSVNAIRRYNALKALEIPEFAPILKEKRELLGMNESFLNRGGNEGFSGGEKKRNEIMALLSPVISILDEIDSGLDIDSLNVVTEGINHVLHDTNQITRPVQSSSSTPPKAVLLITHWKRLLDLVASDIFVHVLKDGQIVKEGKKELAQALEENGYDGF